MPELPQRPSGPAAPTQSSKPAYQGLFLEPDLPAATEPIEGDTLDPTAA